MDRRRIRRVSAGTASVIFVAALAAPSVASPFTGDEKETSGCPKINKIPNLVMLNLVQHLIKSKAIDPETSSG
mgnify:CR=1 FL=1